jgi:hypothetical protein
MMEKASPKVEKVVIVRVCPHQSLRNTAAARSDSGQSFEGINWPRKS